MEQASLRIKIGAIGERQLRKVRNGLLQIGAAATATQAKLNAFSKGYNDAVNKRLTNITKSWKRHFDSVDKMVAMFGKVSLKGLGLMLKATVAEFALMGAAMIGVHALFKAGNLLGRAYHAMLNVVAAGAAAAAVAIAAVAAAMREQTAAMHAYKGRNSGFGEFGSNLNQVRVVMRGLHTDTALASVGLKNLNAAYAAVSKNSTFTRGSQNLLKGLMDFASAGQPLEQGVKAAGEFIGLLQDPKKSFGEITKAAEALGPEMKKAMEEAKKQGINTAEELKEAILSGNLAVLGGVEGQFGAVNSTLVSVLKGGFTEIQNNFADFGQQFLKPLKEVTREVLNTFENAFRRVQGELIRFGNGPFIDSVGGFAEKLSDIFVMLIRDYLPRATGMMQRMADRWERFTKGWNNIKESLRPLIEGARVLEQMLKNIFMPVIDRFREGFGSLNEMIQDNRENLEEFGTKVGAILAKFGEIMDVSRELFFKALPFVNKILEGVKQIVSALGQVFKASASIFGGMGDGFGAFGLLMGAGIMFRSMKNTKGGFVPKNTGTMNVNAGVVNVTGGTAGGQLYPGPANGMRSQTSGGMLPPPVAGTAAQRQSLYSAYRNGGMSGLRAAQQYNRGLGTPGASGYMAGSPVWAGPSALQRFSGQYGPRSWRTGTPTRQRFMEGVGRFNNSGTARMGTMAGLGIASQFMPEETQGAMALGSMVAGFNPLMGLGVAGLGTALTAENSVVGTLGGAAGGAAMGAQFGIHGAIIGAIAGGVVGGVKSFWNKNNAKKDAAREAGEEIGSSMFSEALAGLKGSTAKELAAVSGNLGSVFNVDELRKVAASSRQAIKGDPNRKSMGGVGGLKGAALMGGGYLLGGPLGAAGMGLLLNRRGANIDDAYRKEQIQNIYDNRRALGLEISTEQLAEMMEKPKEALEKLTPQVEAFVDAIDFADSTYNDRMSGLRDALHMTEDQIISLAHETGTNLYDATAKTSDMIASLTQNMIQSYQQLQGAMADEASDVFAQLNKSIEAENAPLIMDEAARALVEMNSEGSLTSADIGEQLTAIYDSLVSLYGGDVFRANQEFTRQFGRGGAAFGQGRTLEGMEGALRSFGPIAQFLDTIGTGSIADNSMVTEQIQSVLRNAGFSVAQGTNFEGRYSALGSAGVRRLAEGITGDIFEGKSQSEIEAILKSYGLDIMINEIEDTGKSLEGQTDEFISQLGRLTKAMNDALADLGIETDPTTTTPPSTGGSSDTSSPRGDTASGRFGRTMAAHRSLSSMINGKQIVTSGWRNFNLGSPSSDHIKGGALDLIGDNLGQYKQMIENGGGFAEFHGSAGSRHLHAVPNTGDSSSPATMGSTAGNMTYNYTINVNGSGADPQLIADTVMSRIKAREQSDRERR